MSIGAFGSLGLAAKMNLILLAVLSVSFGCAAIILLRAGARASVEVEIGKLDVLAKVLAGQAEFGVTGKDKKFLEEVLKSLDAEPQVIFAGAWSQDGLMAIHPPGVDAARFPRPAAEGTRVRADGTVEALSPVRQADRTVGQLQIVSDLRQARARQSASAATLAFVMGGSTLAALVLATLLGRIVTRPLVQMADRFRDIAEGQGDLTQRVEALSSDEVGRLGRNFNTFVARIQDTVKSIGQNTRTLTEASETLHGISGQMTRDASDVAAQSQSVSAASEQVSVNLRAVSDSTQSMTASVREISRHAAGAAETATTAVEAARRASDTLERLGKSGAEVGAVIRLITSVADQTNLLALNATIEAARAGDAGRGFGVVASEVKELARSTTRGAEDVRTLLDAMRRDLGLAKEAIEEIVKVIHDIHGAQSVIASAVAEQTATTAEIGRTLEESARGGASIVGHIHGVAGASRSASDGARQTAEAAAELAQLAAALERVVGSFKV